MGVGKTVVCRELNRMLPASVMLDGDWCWCADPFQVTPETKCMVLDNICHLLGNFLRCSTYENVILCWVMHERAIIDEILGRLPIEECDAEVRAVSLVADEDELRRRVGETLARACATRGDSALALLPPALSRPRHRTRGTTGLMPHDVAARIVASNG